MEIKQSKNVNGKGVFATQKYLKNSVIYVLTGEITSYPTRESIHIGNNKHIYDEYGIFMNHSFTPNVYINNTNVIALKDIEVGDEIVFNYNDTEINMASPFYIGDLLVNGNKLKL